MGKLTFILSEIYYGKAVHDKKGRHLLTSKTSQKVLKHLFDTGHGSMISVVEVEAKPVKSKKASNKATDGKEESTEGTEETSTD